MYVYSYTYVSSFQQTAIYWDIRVFILARVMLDGSSLRALNMQMHCQHRSGQRAAKTILLVLLQLPSVHFQSFRDVRGCCSTRNGLNRNTRSLACIRSSTKIWRHLSIVSNTCSRARLRSFPSISSADCSREHILILSYAYYQINKDYLLQVLYRKSENNIS